MATRMIKIVLKTEPMIVAVARNDRVNQDKVYDIQDTIRIVRIALEMQKSG